MPTHNFGQNPYANYSNLGSYENYGPRPQGPPYQKNSNNGNKYPKNPNQNPFRPQGQGNYPESNSGVGTRQDQGAGPNTCH